MAVVRHKVAWPGIHHARGRRVPITAERCRRMEQQFAAMRAEGIRFPVPWGHQATALPGDPLVPDSAAFLSSRYNAGEVDRLETDPDDGGTVAVLDCPGVDVKDGQLVSTATLPDGTPVTCAIREVSPAIGCTWQDGKGRVWEDILAHVALTPFPVQAGQAGFTPLSADAPLGGVYLSTGAAAMRPPDEKDKPKKPGDEPAADEPDESADPELAEDLTQPADDDGETVPDDGMAAAGPEADRVSRVVGSLAAFGLPLPPDTTPENLLERLDVALTVAKGMKDANAMTQPAADPPAPKQQPQPVQSPGVMMASLPPVAQKFIRTEFKRQRKERLDKIEELVKRGMAVTTANRLRAEVAGVKLSLDPESGDIRQPASIEAVLAAFDESLPALDDPRAMLSTAEPEPSPADPDGGPVQTDPKYGSDLPMTAAQKADIERRSAAVAGTARR